jgi:hypothetical protein
VGAQPLEIRPHDKDDGSRAERQEQHDAKVEFYSLPSLLSLVHLNETSGATASALPKIGLADHVTLGSMNA